MKMRLFVVVCMLTCTSAGMGEDQIRRHGKEKTVRGKIMDMSHTEVKIDNDGIEELIPANEIISIRFDREPAELGSIRQLMNEGHYQKALVALEKVNASEVANPTTKKWVEEEIQFYDAYCNTQLALGGAVEIKNAGNLMKAFYDKNKKSYRFYQSAELMGDLLVAFGAEAQRTDKAKAATLFTAALAKYAEAAQAPWAGADVGLNLKRGHAYMAQGKAVEAIKAYELVINGASGSQAESLKSSAVLGKAKALSAANRAAEGIKLAQEVANTTPKTNVELLAEAYLALGACHRAANMPQDAMLDYLRIDILYAQNPQIHAEALAGLIQIWTELKRPDRSAQARAKLKHRYPNSVWAK